MLNTFPVSNVKGTLMTCYVTCSVSRPARGVFLYHDGHAAGRGSADLKRTDQTSGGGGGSSAGSRVGFTNEYKHTTTTSAVKKSCLKITNIKS